MSKNNDKVLSELLSHQLKHVDSSKKFDYSDIRRLTKYLDRSIFNTDECVLWKGYVTNSNKKEKGVYVNFFFKKNKYALHRLLYLNYIGHLYEDEYLKFTCENKGHCCNIKHIKKLNDKDEKDNKNNKADIDSKENKIKNKEKINTENEKLISESELNFVIDFE